VAVAVTRLAKAWKSVYSFRRIALKGNAFNRSCYIVPFNDRLKQADQPTNSVYWELMGYVLTAFFKGCLAKIERWRRLLFDRGLFFQFCNGSLQPA
jgi:hypothetical protein